MATRFTVCSLLAFLLVRVVTADYELSVTIYSFNNPDNKCAVCRSSSSRDFGCCDNHLVTDPAECTRGTRPCEIALSVCLRESSSRVDTALCPQSGNSLYKSDRSWRMTMLTFSPSLMVNSTGKTWNTVNSQLYIMLNDDDFANGIELVDSFSMDLAPGTRVPRKVLTGNFRLATIELEVSLVCSTNFYGPDCSRSCDRPPCSCDPGFTGEFCENDIDECESVDCSGRGVCQDGVNSYSCTCQDGYIGTNCEVSVVGVSVGSSLGGVLIIVTIVLLIACLISRKKKQTVHIGGFSVNKRGEKKNDQLIMPFLDKEHQNTYNIDENAQL